MKPFDVFHWHPPGWNEPHPCVIVSHPDRVANKPDVDVIMCSTKRATRKPHANEVILDTADGLDWPALAKCDLIYAVPKAELKRRKGEVSEARRSLIVHTIIGSHGWPAVL
jgi:mRNA-degrading endonuclease toxin of MazEF toxin-antitoxin module